MNIEESITTIMNILDEIKGDIQKIRNIQEYLSLKYVNNEIVTEDQDLEIITIKKDIRQIKRRILELEGK